MLRRALQPAVLVVLVASFAGGACAPSSGEDPTGQAGSSAGGGAGSNGGNGNAGSSGAAGAGTAGGSGTGGSAGVAGAAGSTGFGGAAGTGTAGAGPTAGTGGGTAGSMGAAGRGGTGGGAGGQGGTGGAVAGQGGNGRGGSAGGGGSAGTAGAGATGGGGGRGGSPDGGSPDGMGDGGVAYNPCPAAGTACAVLPLGDSITEGCCASPYGGYRIEMFHQAGLGAKNLTFVGNQMNGPTTVDGRTFPKRHEGRGGFTISGGGNGGLAGTVTDSAISNGHPHIVLLMIGTNDINGNINVAQAPMRLGQLIDEIITDAPSALVVVASIIPTRDTNVRQRVQTYNASIPGLVNTRAAMGKHVVFLDNYAEFAKDPNFSTSLMADGLHPNAAGYVVLGRAFYGLIASLLPPAP